MIIIVIDDWIKIGDWMLQNWIEKQGKRIVSINDIP